MQYSKSTSGGVLCEQSVEDLVPQSAEHFVARFAECIVAVPVPRMLMQHAEIASLVPHGQIPKRIVGQIVEVLSPQVDVDG